MMRVFATACRDHDGVRAGAWVPLAALEASLHAIGNDLKTMKTAYAQWEENRPTFLATVWALILLEVVGYGCAFWLIAAYLRERRRRRAAAGPREP